MGWKRVKEHYRIDRYIVQVEPEKGICIGSEYCHDLIAIQRYGGKSNAPRVYWPNASLGRGGELDRYYAEMTADLDQLAALIDEEDQFERSITVYTWNYEGEIVEHLCEEPGWPNVTHRGKIMNNRFSVDRNAVIAKAIENTIASVDNAHVYLTEVQTNIIKAERRYREDLAALARLRHEQIVAALTPIALPIETTQETTNA